MIAVGCDHAGFPLKKEVIKYLDEKKIPYTDFGTFSDAAADYPVYGRLVANAVAGGEADFGIIICGTGIGISIAANKVKGVRAALCHDLFSARATREHNDANILAMGARIIEPSLAFEIIDTFLNTAFTGEERHIRRVSMIEQG